MVHLLRLVVVLWGAQEGLGSSPRAPPSSPVPAPREPAPATSRILPGLMAMPSPRKDGEGRRGGPSPSPVSRLPTHICFGRPEGGLCGQLPGAAWVQDQEASPLVLGWDDHHHLWVAPAITCTCQLALGTRRQPGAAPSAPSSLPYSPPEICVLQHFPGVSHPFKNKGDRSSLLTRDHPRQQRLCRCPRPSPPLLAGLLDPLLPRPPK